MDNDGAIQLPLIGTVSIAGKTTEQIRVFLEQTLSRYVREPKVAVQLIFPGSIRYHLLGQFVSPGLKYAERPMRLLENVSTRGSIGCSMRVCRPPMSPEAAKRSRSTFDFCCGREICATTFGYVRATQLSFQITSTNRRLYSPGPRPGCRKIWRGLPFVQGQLDILQALAASGIGFRDRAQGLLSEVRVIRSESDRGQFFVVDVNKILRGDAASFLLAPGDIVFIPESTLTNWNEAIQQLLPTLTTISGLLTPFVQIKFLSQ